MSKLSQRCWSCGEGKVILKKCSDCRLALYCGEECQLRNWGMHRGECPVYRDQKGVELLSDTNEDIAEWLDDALDDVVEYGHIKNVDLEIAEELIDLLLVTSDVTKMRKVRQRAISTAIDLEHRTHDLSEKDIEKAISMKFDDSFDEIDLLEALDKTNRKAVMLLESLVQDEKSRNGELGNIDSQYRTLNTSEVGDNRQQMKLNAKILSEFEEEIECSQRIANDLYSEIRTNTLTEDSVRDAVGKLVHITHSTNICDGYDLIGVRRRRRDRKRSLEAMPSAKQKRRALKRKQRRGKGKARRRNRRKRRSERRQARRAKRSKRTSKRRTRRKNRRVRRVKRRTRRRSRKRRNKERRGLKRVKRRENREKGRDVRRRFARERRATVVSDKGRLRGGTSGRGSGLGSEDSLRDTNSRSEHLLSQTMRDREGGNNQGTANPYSDDDNDDLSGSDSETNSDTILGSETSQVQCNLSKYFAWREMEVAFLVECRARFGDVITNILDN